VYSLLSLPPAFRTPRTRTMNPTTRCVYARRNPYARSGRHFRCVARYAATDTRLTRSRSRFFFSPLSAQTSESTAFMNDPALDERAALLPNKRVVTAASTCVRVAVAGVCVVAGCPVAAVAYTRVDGVRALTNTQSWLGSSATNPPPPGAGHGSDDYSSFTNPTPPRGGPRLGRLPRHHGLRANLRRERY